MNQQVMPFFESAEAATKHAIQVSGKTVKQVAAMLWPGKTVDAAQTRLANCLNESREEKLTADEHCRIADCCDSYEFLYYLCHRLNHSRPVQQTPTEQAAQLQAALFSKTDELRGLLAAIDLLKPKLVQAVAP